jgi:hypothetical protein
MGLFSSGLGGLDGGFLGFPIRLSSNVLTLMTSSNFVRCKPDHWRRRLLRRVQFKEND